VITLKSKLSRGEVTVGSWISTGNAATAEIFCNAGFDWVVVDLEHSAIDISRAEELIRIVDLAGATPLTRVTSNNPDQIKRVMDAGAKGIVVPMVNSREEAEAAVAATRYSPDGNRGVGLGRAQGYGATFDQYKTWQVDGPVVVVQIEHLEAVDKLEEILSVPGVDAYMIGPYDLSGSMGIPGEFDSQEYIDIVENIKQAGERIGCPSGIHVVEPDKADFEDALRAGFKFIAYSVDIRMLDKSASDGVRFFRESAVCL
jgi:2-dehydro-3-deoxyglucarate aldolase